MIFKFIYIDKKFIYDLIENFGWKWDVLCIWSLIVLFDCYNVICNNLFYINCIGFLLILIFFIVFVGIVMVSKCISIYYKVFCKVKILNRFICYIYKKV